MTWVKVWTKSDTRDHLVCMEHVTHINLEAEPNATRLHFVSGETITISRERFDSHVMPYIKMAKAVQ